MNYDWSTDSGFMKEQMRRAALPLSERLRMEAADQRKIAEQYNGCSFYGEHPATPHLCMATLLDEAALCAELNEKKQLARERRDKRKKDKET
jgi:hypothetical protein